MLPCSRLWLRIVVLNCLAAPHFVPALVAQERLSQAWNPDRGDGTYNNPILFADYSDPDVMRVDKDFYLVSSSFDQVPGLPILHSIDLVHWELVSHALPVQIPEERYRQTQHGGGVWAPSIRYHDGVFYIFYPDPDFGIYMTKAKSITGPWSIPVLVKAAKGWIDPCPIWDDDGNAYLVNGLAGSRAGANSAVVLSRMAVDGSHLLDDGVLILDGHDKDPTLEGPKIYKRAGFYYIFAPAGGVSHGWQTVFRSANIYGPYERRVVLAQGGTTINGPHQGAWVDTEQGEDWFVHFQDQGPYGRVVLLEPMQWLKDGWPRIGIRQDANGRGEPVTNFQLPKLDAPRPGYNLADSDEFNGARIGLQWQWQANPSPTWALPFPGSGVLRVMNVYQSTPKPNLWDVPNLLLQKFPARSFTVTTKFTPHLLFSGEQTGLVVMGHSYSALLLRKTADSLMLVQSTRRRANENGLEEQGTPVQAASSTFYFRARIDADANVHFSYSTDGVRFEAFGTQFRAERGDWIGAKIGIVATGVVQQGETGYADFDWFRVEK